jgi:hypothetical protein
MTDVPKSACCADYPCLQERHGSTASGGSNDLEVKTREKDMRQECLKTLPARTVQEYGNFESDSGAAGREDREEPYRNCQPL